MQALLSFEQAPPLATPFRFFLAAPLFAILAGTLLLWVGPELFGSRWTPAALALTHLITVGFMLQVMLGAMIQILPVVAGANITRAPLVVALVHMAITLGTLLLAAGFLSHQPLAFSLAVLLLGIGVALFVGAAGSALYGLPHTNPTIRGLKSALLGLSVTAGLGVVLALARNGVLQLPGPQLASIHLGWGFFGWSLVLLSGIASVVVPMFQMTPAYPAWFTRLFSTYMLALLCLWTPAASADWRWASTIPEDALVLAAAFFAVQTLLLQGRSKRSRLDATHRFWQTAMCCTLAACVLWFVARAVPVFATSREWPLLCGVLVLFGGFMSVMIGMLYKIVPFLVWLHLQNLGGGLILAPNMNKVIPTRQIDRQMYTHYLALGLLLAAVVWPDSFARAAGLALLVGNLWLLRNLLTAARVYQRRRIQIACRSPA